MIASLSGTVTAKGKNYLVLDVHGVGYRVFVTPQVMTHVQRHAALTLWTHTHVREDALDLFGFPDEDALALFEQLLGVTGVGPKTAIGVLAIANPGEIRNAIASGDATILIKVSGIGKKIAERIVLELKEKTGVTHVGESSAIAEAIDALVHLGYSEKDARETVSAAQKKQSANSTTQSLVKASLRMMRK